MPRLPVGGVIEGTVRLPAEGHVGELRVIADNNSRRRRGKLAARVDADGAYHFSGLELDTTYQLRAERLDPEGLPGTLAHSGLIELNDAHPHARVDLVVSALAQVHARVVDAHGRYVEGATVSLVRSPVHSIAGILAHGKTGPEGEVLLIAPAVGAARVSANTDCQDAPLVECVLSSGRITDLTLELPRAFSLAGTLRDWGGEPVAVQDVVAVEPGHDWRLYEDHTRWLIDGEASTDESGWFRHDCVPEAVVDVWIPLEEERGATFVHHFESIPNVAAGAGPVELTLARRARVVGRVQVDHALDVAVRCAHCGSQEPESFELEVGEDGRFEVLLGPEPRPVGLLLWLDPEQPTIVAGILPRPGETIDLGLIEPNTMPVLTGLLVDALGEPVNGGEVSLELGGRAICFEAEADGEGHYRFEHLPRGPGRLIAEQRGFAAVTIDFEDPLELQGRRVVLARMARLVGRVSSRSGTLRGRLSVTLKAIGVTQAPESGLRGQSKPDGSFVLHAPAGRWRVVLGHFTTWIPFDGPTVELVAGELCEVEFELP